jgi:hypothetical protein
MLFVKELLKTLLQTVEELIGLVAMFAAFQLTGSPEHVLGRRLALAP